MKPLFLSIAIVGAISLWYSNAQADESRRDLHKDLSLASQHIYNESRDSERRGVHRGVHRDDGQAVRDYGSYADRGYYSRTYRH